MKFSSNFSELISKIQQEICKSNYKNLQNVMFYRQPLYMNTWDFISPYFRFSKDNSYLERFFKQIC